MSDDESQLDTPRTQAATPEQVISSSDEFEGFIDGLSTDVRSHVPEQLDESIEKSSSVYTELESVAEALKTLSPIEASNRDFLALKSDFELAQKRGDSEFETSLFELKGENHPNSSRDFSRQQSSRLRVISVSAPGGLEVEFGEITDSNLAKLDQKYDSVQELNSTKRDSLVSKGIDFWSQLGASTPSKPLVKSVKGKELVKNQPKMAPGKETKPGPSIIDPQQLFEEIEDDVMSALDLLTGENAGMIREMTGADPVKNKANAKVYLDKLNKLQENLDENYGLLRRKCIGVDRAAKSEVRAKIGLYEKLLFDLKLVANKACADAGALGVPPVGPGPKVTKISPLKLPTFSLSKLGDPFYSK